MFDFGIGMPELLIIGMVALIVVGPKDLPKLLKTIGKYIGKIKSMASEFQTHIDDAIKETGVADIKNDLEQELGDAGDFDFEADFKKQEEELTKVFETAAVTPDEKSVTKKSAAKSKTKKSSKAPAKKATKKTVKKVAAKKPAKKAAKKPAKKA